MGEGKSGGKSSHSKELRAVRAVHGATSSGTPKKLSFVYAIDGRIRPMSQDKIVVVGARENNLKNITVEIPRDRLVVITGLSGKSSLARD